MSAPDISAEAVERLAQYHDRAADSYEYDDFPDLAKRHRVRAATLRALRAALDAAEQNAHALLNNDRDVVRVHEGGGPEDVWMSLAVTMAKTREARDAAAAGYARGVRDVLKTVQREVHILGGNAPLQGRLEAAILALLPAITETKETRDDQ